MTNLAKKWKPETNLIFHLMQKTISHKEIHCSSLSPFYFCPFSLCVSTPSQTKHEKKKIHWLLIQAKNVSRLNEAAEMHNSKQLQADFSHVISHHQSKRKPNNFKEEWTFSCLQNPEFGCVRTEQKYQNSWLNTLL